MHLHKFAFVQKLKEIQSRFLEFKKHIKWLYNFATEHADKSKGKSIHQCLEGNDLQEQLHFFLSAFEQSGSSIVITDALGSIEFVNPRFTEITGYTFEEAKGKNPRILRSGETPSETYNELWETISSGEVWKGEFINRKKNKDIYWEYAIIAPMKDQFGQITHYVAIKEDITKRKHTEEQLTYRATHDPLTGVANRIYFIERLKQALSSSQRHNQDLAVLFLDLDSFKLVNDRLGHQVGDKVLSMVGKRLKHILRTDDTIARLGGDEFGIILEKIKSRDDAITVSKKILDHFHTPFHVDNSNIDWLSVTVGITMCSKNSCDPDTLIKQADQAMYHAKEQGKNNYAFYTQQIH